MQEAKAAFVARASDGRPVRRPLSPHLGIYRWPITMVSSILNRATGIAATLGLLLLVWWLVAASQGPAAFAAVQAFIAAPLGLLLLLGWTASLFYHLFSGIRHLAWDIVVGYEKPALNPGTFVVFGLTVAATAITWMVGYARLGS